jgi:hypothetical protein
VTGSTPARITPRRIRIRRTRASLVVVATVAAAIACHSLATSSSIPPASSSSRAAPPTRVPRSQHRGAPGRVEGVVPGAAAVSRDRGGLGEAGGAVPAGTTVFDDWVPGVAELDPALRRALGRAATDAGGDGVELIVNSGWRSPAYEDQLRREAVAKYGSEAEAARWVATATTSPHVSGDAVDIGPSNAAAWLSVHGAAYELCQIYANEPWHYELRPGAVDHGCPAMYADPTLDPRMHR